jgi:F-type H+-transporting ATPase subunit b
MLIDWFTVGAQALNFTVLVWLLKRFLYQPVLAAIAAREALIAHQLADADAVRRTAEQQRQAFVQKSDAFDQQRAALLEKAQHEAQAEREKLLASARAAADALGTQRREALRDELTRVQHTLVESTQREVFGMARRVLADLASAKLEDHLADMFVQRLEQLDDAECGPLLSALSAPAAQALVRSAFDLSDAQCAAITSAVKRRLGGPDTLRFATAPELVCGIELTIGGHKLAWSIDQYLGGLQQTVAGLLDSASRHSTAPGPSSDGRSPPPATGTV